MKDLEVIPVESKERWRVIYKENEKWQCGIYIPENKSLNEIKFVERHNAPELFMLIKGNVTLVIVDEEGNLKEIPMKPEEIYIIATWHNAYRPNGKEGIVLVIERPDIKTEYMSLKR